MTNALTKRLANALAYVAIVGHKKSLHGSTRVKLIDYTELARSDDYSRLYNLNAAGMELAQTSQVWKSHQALIAAGFRYSARLRATPSFIHYEHQDPSQTKSGKSFFRAAFIGKNGRAWTDQPDDATGSGWNMKEGI